jgi:hypothetical protein
MIVLIVSLVLAFGLQASATGLDDKAVGGLTGTVPLPPFRPSFTWTSVFQQHDPADRYDLASPNFPDVRPPIILRHVEVNEGAAPNTFELGIERLSGWGSVMLIGKCVRD